MRHARSQNPFQRRLNVALAELGLARKELAVRLKVPDTTLAAWCNGVNPAPIDLARRIEVELGLENGALPDPPPITRAPA